MKYFILITILCAIVPCFVYADTQPDKHDCYYLLDNINNDKLFANIQVNSFIYYNTGKYRDKYMQKDLNFLKTIIKCMDKIYTINKKGFNFRDKLRYYYYRNIITISYARDETLINYQKYLYITYRFRDNDKAKLKFEFPYDADMSAYYEDELIKKYGMKSAEELKKDILEDTKLKNDPDLNEKLF